MFLRFMHQFHMVCNLDVSTYNGLTNVEYHPQRILTNIVVFTCQIKQQHIHRMKFALLFRFDGSVGSSCMKEVFLA